MNGNARVVSSPRVLAPVESLTQFFNGCYWMQSLLAMAILMTALGVVYVTNATRVMYSDSQAALMYYNKLQVQRSKLLIEKGAIQSQSYIQKVAHDKLGMVVPTNQDTVMVKV